MPTFDTPQPIALTVELGVGDVRIVAGDRVDTVVDVRPTDPAKKADVTAAQQTRIDFANGALVVEASKGWRQWSPRGGHGSVDVRIEVPSGSSMSGSAGVTSVRCTGRIGQCRYHTGVGDITLEEAGSVELKAGVGAIAVDVVGGRADVRTSGPIRIGRIDGSAVIKNSNGDTWIGEVEGEARLNSANGTITVEHARSGVTAKTANGDVRLGDVGHGPVVAQSAFGAVEVGITDGVPAWLELETRFGHVRNDLDDAEPPEPGEEAVEVHAHTSMGDITIRRSFAGTTGGERR